MTNFVIEVHLPVLSVAIWIPVFMDIIMAECAIWFTRFKTRLQDAFAQTGHKRDDMIAFACREFVSRSHCLSDVEKEVLTKCVPKENVLSLRYAMIDNLKIAVDKMNVEDESTHSGIAAQIFFLDTLFEPDRLQNR